MEEDDYMSDKFLFEGKQDDTRPGLIHSHSEQRKHSILKRKATKDQENKAKFRPYRIVEREKRQEGLQAPISSDNKGFALMLKMGYQPGSGVGKSGTGCVEPVSIEVKTDRKGLACKEPVKVVKANKKPDRSKEIMDVGDYRLRLSRERAEKQMGADLRRSQVMCMQLDNGKDLEEPVEPWFWPEDAQLEEETLDMYTTETEHEQENEDVADDENESEEYFEDSVELSPPEKLEMITHYLRNTHMYCIWCGTQYDDIGDLEENCPGPSRDEH